MGVDDVRGTNPFDDSWDDDGWDLYDGSDDGYWPLDDESVWADAELDGQVRQQLATLVPLRHEAFDRWDEIQPRMTRARRRRHAAQALATSVLVAAVALAGVQGAGRFLPEDTSVVSAADGGDDMSTSDSQRPMVGIGEASSTIAADGDPATPSSDDANQSPDGDPATDTPGVDETSLTAAGAAPGSVVGSSVPVNGGSAASSVSIPPPVNTPTTAAPVTSSPTFRSTTTTRAATTTTRATTTTTRATTSTSVITVRDLSTIDVTVRGSEIRLVAIHNASGVTSQVHNSGPEKIEITFTEGSEKHDLLATVRNGNVVTSIVDSDDD